MARSIRPDELEKIRKAVTGDAEEAAREAAGKALRKAIPFEPAPGDAAGTDAPHQAHIHFPGTRARLTSDPKRGAGGDVDLDVTNHQGVPVDVPEITAGGGTQNGHATLDPRDVPKALEELGGAEINKNTQFAGLVDSSPVTTGKPKGR